MSEHHHEESLSAPGWCHVCRQRWPCYVNTLEAERDALRQENRELRTVAREQWESNHAAHCDGTDGPCEGERAMRCGWLLPAVLDDTGESDLYE